MDSTVIQAGSLRTCFALLFYLCSLSVSDAEEKVFADHADVLADPVLEAEFGMVGKRELSTIPIDPMHPLADENSLVFKARYSDYLKQREEYKSANSEVIVEDPLHPLADPGSSSFKVQHAEYLKQEQAYMKEHYTQTPVDPLHPLADTNSEAFKAEYVEYLNNLDDYSQTQVLNKP